MSEVSHDRKNHLTGAEVAAVVVHATKIAPLVMSLFNPQSPPITDKYAAEFVESFMHTFLEEKGDGAITFINSLDDDQKVRLQQVLKAGKAADSVILTFGKSLNMAGI
jgi:lauroyl/myristoyl acyltransferase